MEERFHWKLNSNLEAPDLEGIITKKVNQISNFNYSINNINLMLNYQKVDLRKHKQFHKRLQSNKQYTQYNWFFNDYCNNQNQRDFIQNLFWMNSCSNESWSRLGVGVANNNLTPYPPKVSFLPKVSFKKCTLHQQSLYDFPTLEFKCLKGIGKDEMMKIVSRLL